MGLFTRFTPVGAKLYLPIAVLKLRLLLRVLLRLLLRVVLRRVLRVALRLVLRVALRLLLRVALRRVGILYLIPRFYTFIGLNRDSIRESRTIPHIHAWNFSFTNIINESSHLFRIVDSCKMNKEISLLP